MDWAMLVAYNRGKMESVKGSPIYTRFRDFSKGCDMISGYIADDRMFVVLDRFFNGEITDRALIYSLSALKLGKQYVALSSKACGKIKIVEVHDLSDEERIRLKEKSEENRFKGVTMANEICRKYRREGRYLDEILQTGELND